MKEQIDFLMLDSIKKHGSLMPLFKVGYSYAKVMKWGKQLEIDGEILYHEDGIRSLTELGKQRWKFLKKGIRDFSILPIEEYRIAKLNIDDIYLP